MCQTLIPRAGDACLVVTCPRWFVLKAEDTDYTSLTQQLPRAPEPIGCTGCPDTSARSDPNRPPEPGASGPCPQEAFRPILDDTYKSFMPSGPSEAICRKTTAPLFSSMEFPRLLIMTRSPFEIICSIHGCWVRKATTCRRTCSGACSSRPPAICFSLVMDVRSGSQSAGIGCFYPAFVT